MTISVEKQDNLRFLYFLSDYGYKQIRDPCQNEDERGQLRRRKQFKERFAAVVRAEKFDDETPYAVADRIDGEIILFPFPSQIEHERAERKQKQRFK